MMNMVSIKINVADRIYPIRIKAEEEELVREAARGIDEHISKLALNYAPKDKQDLLAMSLLYYATTSARLDGSNTIEDKDISERLERLNQQLNQFLAINK
jgi:hypothetical protein